MQIDTDSSPVATIPGQLTLFDPEDYLVVGEVVPPADKAVAVILGQLTLFDPDDYVVLAEVVSLADDTDGALSRGLKVAA